MIRVSVSLQLATTLCVCLRAWAGAGAIADTQARGRRPGAEGRITEPRLPASLAGWFDIPTSGRDRHGNPVTRRNAEGLIPGWSGDPPKPDAAAGLDSSYRLFDPRTGLPYEIWHRRTGMEFVLIQPGTFQMGSTDEEVAHLHREMASEKYRPDYSDECPRHTVRITEPFYLGKYEVTQGQWCGVARMRPWVTRGYPFVYSDVETGRDYAVSYVSWDHCQRFIGRLNSRPEYRDLNSAALFSLPTEVEWEYACRAGSTTRFCHGHDAHYLKLGQYAWFTRNAYCAYRKYAQLVGRKQPNAWGLYDMHGNVWERCQDRYGRYEPYAQDDPQGPDTGPYRVGRGGSWRSDPRSCRSAVRRSGLDDSGAVGFRCCLRGLGEGELAADVPGSEAKAVPLFPVDRGWIDRAGQMVIRSHWQDTKPFSEGLAPGCRRVVRCVVDAGYWESLDRAEGKAPSSEPGEERPSTIHVSPAEYYRKVGAGKPFEGRVETVWRWGYIDGRGKVVIEPQFDWAGRFSEGLAAVRRDRGYSYIDRTGKAAIGLRRESLSSAGPFSEGLALLEIAEGDGHSYRFIDCAGKTVIAWQGRNRPLPFSHGVTPICLIEDEREVWHYIDRKGELAIKGPFEAAESFSEGLAAVRRDGKWGYIDTRGKVVIKPKFLEARRFSEGLASVKHAEGYGYVNSVGVLAIPPGPYAHGQPFSEGLACLGRTGRYIDRLGRTALTVDLNHLCLGPFRNGLAQVLLARYGSPQWDPSGTWHVSPRNVIGYLDKTGKLVWPPGYQRRGEAEQPDRKQTEFADRSGMTREFVNSIGMKMALIPPGEYQMGSERSTREVVVTYGGRRAYYMREHPRHTVKIAAPFYMGATEVTQAQWHAVMGTDPAYFRGDGHCPMQNVSWSAAQEFCRRLSEKEKLAYRLPTEAEWEYACRAGATTEFCFGDDADTLGWYAWYRDNSAGRTQPAAQKKPNAWGLYDMHGNVWEWCQDVWHSSYAGAPTDGSAWLAGDDQTARVFRGGGSDSHVWGVRCAYRTGNQPGASPRATGFRVVSGPPGPSYLSRQAGRVSLPIRRLLLDDRDELFSLLLAGFSAHRWLLLSGVLVTLLATVAAVQVSRVLGEETPRWFRRELLLALPSLLVLQPLVPCSMLSLFISRLLFLLLSSLLITIVFVIFPLCSRTYLVSAQYLWARLMLKPAKEALARFVAELESPSRKKWGRLVDLVCFSIGGLLFLALLWVTGVILPA